MTSLLAGSYDVAAELTGFKTAVRQNVPVQSDTSVRVDFVLDVGGIGETVEVQAAADTRLLRTEDASLGAVLSESQVQGLPVKNRNFMALVQLVPGATESLEGNQNTLGRSQPLNLSVHGQRHFDNNIRLDGVSIIAGFANGSTFIPSLESLKEVSVQTGQYGAAYGMYSGAQVDMIVKSGQNTPHGSALHLPSQRRAERAAVLRSGGPAAVRLQPVRRHARRDRSSATGTFFFFGYEGTRSDRETTGTATVATGAMRRGDFSALSTHDPRSVHAAAVPRQRHSAESSLAAGAGAARSTCRRRRAPGCRTITSPPPRPRSGRTSTSAASITSSRPPVRSSAAWRSGRRTSTRSS